MADLTQLGAMALVLTSRGSFVAGRQRSAVNLCTSPLPDGLVALATSEPERGVPAIAEWLLSEPRVWLFANDDHTIAAIRFSTPPVELSIPGVGSEEIRLGVMTPLSFDEVYQDETASELFVRLFAIARTVFPVWANDESLDDLGAMGPTYVSLAGERAEA